MGFELTEEQRLIKDNFRAFLEKEIVPLVDDYERERRTLGKDIIKKLDEFRFAAALVSEDAGGVDLDFQSYCVMVEELSRAWPSLRTLATTSAMMCSLIASRGTAEQREKCLPGLLAMDEIGCFALTEPNVGSDASSVETKAVRSGDHYLLSGTKTLITGGSMADVAVVYARVSGGDGAGGVSAFLVRQDESPFETRDIAKMGMHCAPLAELVFDECAVPAANRLGEEGGGLKMALHGLNSGRVNVAFAALGLGQAALDASISYARDREQFGKPIASFQLVQQMIVEMSLKVDIARLLAMRAAEMVNKKVECRREASYAKLYATEAMVEVTNTAIQVHGGYGYTSEFAVERYYRDLRHLTMAEGTTQVQTLIIGREILGVSAFV